MAIRYPAIFVGGPPNSGKSWLVWNLNMALRRANVVSYVLRAHPDGEGAWRYEAPPPIADELRFRAKQGWTPTFAQQISRDIEHRHLPLIVDVGGKVTKENRQIMASCTGAVLIAGDPTALAPWRDEVQQLNLPLLADLHSIRSGEPQLIDGGVTLRGSISGLGRDEQATGPCFAELVRRLSGLFHFEDTELYRHHAALIDVEPLHLGRSIGDLPAHSSAGPLWKYAELAQLLRAVDRTTPLALYGVAPQWVYAALAAHSLSEPWIFQVALGWVKPPPVTLGSPGASAVLTWTLRETADATHIQIHIPNSRLDYEEICKSPLVIPSVDRTKGVILDGKLPIWLSTALARAYTAAAWVAIREARTDPPQAVVIAAHDLTAIGTLRALAGAGDRNTE